MSACRSHGQNLGPGIAKCNGTPASEQARRERADRDYARQILKLATDNGWSHQDLAAVLDAKKTTASRILAGGKATESQLNRALSRAKT